MEIEYSKNFKVREFCLINDMFEEFSLMDIDNYCYFSDPSGLGYSYSAQYRNIDGFYMIDNKVLNQQSISGMLNFINYDNYTKFINFIEKSNKLILSYTIPYNDNNKTFYRDIDLSSIDKSEKDKDLGILVCQISFNSLSLWYEKIELIYNLKPVENEIRWDFRWDSYFNSYDNRSISIFNDGDDDASIKLEINGYINKPKISLYINKEFKQSLKIPIILEENESLLYSSKKGECFIYKKETDGSLTDLKNLDYLDIYNDNCIRLEKNKTNLITLQCGDNEDEEITNAKLTIYKYFKSV